MFRNRSFLFLASRHSPIESHLNSRRYYFVFLTLTFPPVICAAPEKISISDWNSFTVSVVGDVGGGAIWMMVELSTKQYPNNLGESW